MLDQTFSLKNFQEIYDTENRKGHDLEKEFVEFADLYNKTRQIKRATGLAKKAQTSTRKKNIFSMIKKYKKQKEEMLDAHLLDIEKEIQSGKFKVLLKQGPDVRGKTTYIFDKSPTNFFASKQTQKNLRKVFRIKISSRDNILAQLKCVLFDNLPKIVIKTDIKDFYETVQQAQMLNIIESNVLLDLVSKHYVREVLSQYNKIKHVDSVGLPRGVGVSAYLSEIYMQKLDAKIKCMQGLVYFARYVDDIVMVFSLTDSISLESIMQSFDNICKELSLNRNEIKTKTIKVENNTKDSFDFLGYKINIIKNKTTLVQIDFTDKKIEKLKHRIAKAFNIFVTTKNKRSAAHILYQRINFLTSNTRLLNSKNNVMVGVYFSNRFLTVENSLNLLDEYVASFYNVIHDDNLLSKIKELSFVRGWNDRIYHKYSTKKLKQITKIWRYDENC